MGVWVGVGVGVYICVHMYVLCMWLVCVNIRIVSGTVIYNVHYNIM